MRHMILFSILLMGTMSMNAQKVTKYTTTENAPWVTTKTALASKSNGSVVVSVDGNEKGTVFRFIKGRELMQIDDIMKLLAQTHWACNRSRETVERSIENSLCFGILDRNGSDRRPVDHRLRKQPL